VRNTFAFVELIETFLYRSHKLNSLRDLFNRRVVWQGANRLKYDLFLCHGSIMKFEWQIVQAQTKESLDELENGTPFKMLVWIYDP
jgi:hypothetical protein